MRKDKIRNEDDNGYHWNIIHKSEEEGEIQLVLMKNWNDLWFGCSVMKLTDKQLFKLVDLVNELKGRI